MTTSIPDRLRARLLVARKARDACSTTALRTALDQQTEADRLRAEAEVLARYLT